MAMGKPSWRLWLAMLSTVLSSIGFAIALRWGIVAVAITVVIREYLVFPIGQLAVSRLIQIPFWQYLRQFIAPLGCALMMMLVIFLTKYLLKDLFHPFVSIATCILLGSTVYCISIWVFSRSLFHKLIDYGSQVFRSQKQRNI